MQQLTLTSYVMDLQPNKTDDRALGEILNLIMFENKRVTGKTIEALCSHDKCRPKTLETLISVYIKNTCGRNTTTTMNRSLITFSKNPHLQDELSNIIEIVMYLCRYGADPLWKDEDGKDSVDYAYNIRAVKTLDILLRFAPSNPIRKVHNMLLKEQIRQDGTNPMKSFLKQIQKTFQTQSKFVQNRFRIFSSREPRQFNLPPSQTQTSTIGNQQNIFP